MQQSLDRRQPSARFRSPLREIPHQRRYGNGEHSWQWTPPSTAEEDRTDDPLQGRGALDKVADGPEVTTAPEALEEHTRDLVDAGLTDADAPGDDEPPAAPAAEPVDLSALPAGSATDVAERPSPPTAEVAGHQPAAGDLLTGEVPVVSDQAWEWMEPLLPTTTTRRRGGRWRDHRQVVEAICWKYRTGAPWRELPARFGPWQTAYERLTRWGADGTWARLLAQARTTADPDTAGELDWLVAVNSAVTRVHQPGAGTRQVGGEVATDSPDGLTDGAAA
jgi:transposase